MSRHGLRLPAALIAALALAGCGSSGTPAPTAGHQAPSTAGGGPLTVAPNGGAVGDATSATSGQGAVQLPTGQVKTDPRLQQGVDAGASCADVDLMPAADNLAAVNAATVCLVNGARADAGLPPLSVNPKLEQSSTGHSDDMVQNQYFAHEDASGGDVISRVRPTGYLPDSGEWTLGENLAWGTGTLATPRGIVDAWMKSQGHRENILREGFKEEGLGIVLGNPRATDGEGATYTMNFGAVAAASPDATDSADQSVASEIYTGAADPSVSAKRKPAARKSVARKKARRARAARLRRARLARARAARARAARARRASH